MGGGRRRRGGAGAGDGRIADGGVLVAVDLRGADARSCCGAAGGARDARSGARRRAEGDTSPDRPHVLANLALALSVGSAHGGAVPARVAARGGLAAVAGGGGDRGHGGAGGGARGRAVVSGPARRHAVGGGRRVGADRRWARGSGAAAGRERRLDDRAAGAGRPRPRALDRLADGGRAARADPPRAARRLDDRGAPRGRRDRPGGPHADLHRRPAQRGGHRPRRRSPRSCSMRRCRRRRSSSLADGLERQLIAERGRVPDLRPAFSSVRLPASAGGRGRDSATRPRRSGHARRDPRVSHGVPRGGGARAAGAGARAWPSRTGADVEGAGRCRSSPCCS